MPRGGKAAAAAAGSVQQRLDTLAAHFDGLQDGAEEDALLDQQTGTGKRGRGGAAASPHKRGRVAEEVEDKLLLKRAVADTSGATSARLRSLTCQPSLLKNGTLRDFQLEGVRWLINLHRRNINGILADEMGLGKTIQAIAMIAYLVETAPAKAQKTQKNIVVAPKSVLSNWLKEFSHWLPTLRVIMVGGSKEERTDQLKGVTAGDFDVVVTSFEMITLEKAALKKVAWNYMVIDEAHRIKNEKSQLAQGVRDLSTQSRLLLTGTPLQNNLHELWALLNFLVPSFFADAADFDALFHSSDRAEDVTARLRRILRPLMLRRLKRDVEAGLPSKTQVNLTIPLSATQRKLYGDLLKHDMDAINGTGGDRSRLLNIVMQLRKCCNHPYLFEGQEPGPPFVEGPHLVDKSAKLKVLDRLLDKAKDEGVRVLVFSQMTRMLDILEDYCVYAGHDFCRIDGGVSGEERDQQVDAFMREDSDKLLFLLSTRAGGLGLNLQRANWVVLYDSDWNPQADIQAMDRCHRIGQTKPVTVFRFVSEHSVEERIVEQATKKLFLDAMVVQQGRLVEKGQAAKAQAMDKQQLLQMIRFGADSIMKIGDVDAEIDIEHLLNAGRVKTEQFMKRFKDMAQASMAETFRSDGGANVSSAEHDPSVESMELGGAGGADWPDEGFVLDIGKRARKEVKYNVEALQKEQMARLGREDEDSSGVSDGGNKKRKTMIDQDWTMIDGCAAGVKSGKPGPADFLLRRLIEMERTRAGAQACETFEFRGGGDCYFIGRYDASGMIVGECSEDGDADAEELKRFPSLASWAFTIKGRAVSVKPVVYYKNKHLRQHENEAASAALNGAAHGVAWDGPTSPAGVVAWREALSAGVRDSLMVSEDEVLRIVRQELESKALKLLTSSLKDHSRAAAAAAASAAAVAEPSCSCAAENVVGGKGKGPELDAAARPWPVSGELLAQLRETIELSGLYTDTESAAASMLKRAGASDAFLARVFPPGTMIKQPTKKSYFIGGAPTAVKGAGAGTVPSSGSSCGHKAGSPGKNTRENVRESRGMTQHAASEPSPAKASKAGQARKACTEDAYLYLHILTRARAHTHTHTYVHTQPHTASKHACMLASMPACLLACIHACTRAGATGSPEGHWMRSKSGQRLWVRLNSADETTRTQACKTLDGGAAKKEKQKQSDSLFLGSVVQDEQAGKQTNGRSGPAAVRKGATRPKSAEPEQPLKRKKEEKKGGRLGKSAGSAGTGAGSQNNPRGGCLDNPSLEEIVEALVGKVRV